MTSWIASTPEPPYYAVVFTSVRTPADPSGYEATAARMLELAARQRGFLGVESTRNDEGAGITVSYWSDLNAIRRWREEAEHRQAQAQGRNEWYAAYRLRICRVEREIVFDAADQSPLKRVSGPVATLADESKR